MALGKPIVDSSVDLYFQVLQDLKPIPAKSHYTFNLRDVSKIVQGVLMMKPSAIPNKECLAKLWAHECLRVFCDRLIDDDDRKYFQAWSATRSRCSSRWAGRTRTSSRRAEARLRRLHQDGRAARGPQVRGGADTTKLPQLFTDYLDEYNAENKEMRLVFFWDACDHVNRLARVLRQPRGNAMLVGVGGSGKQSLTRFAAFMSEMKCFQIELTKGYGYNEFREDLKKLFLTAGCDKTDEGVIGAPIVFLFADTQVVEECFIEDINNILNSGEVPNLFANDEWEKICSAVRPLAKDLGIAETKDNLKALFVSHVRENLHIVLAMSPVGSAFRVRCRMFPSLINCCTIDWYDRWPVEALRSVARQFLEPLDFGEDPAVRETVLNGLIEMSSHHPHVGDRCLGRVLPRAQAQVLRDAQVFPRAHLALPRHAASQAR